MNAIQRAFALFAIVSSTICCLQAQDLNDPSKILEIMDNSKVSYQVQLDPAFKAEAPERGDNNSPDLYQSNGEDGAGIGRYTLDSVSKPLFEKAEAAFAEGKFEEARTNYQAILSQQPDFAMLMTYTGQSYEAEKNYPEAIKWYRKAIDVNFHDYMAHWFLADDLYRLKKYDEAATEIATAWVLNRNHKTIRERMEVIFKAAGLKYDGFEFIPQYRLTKAKDLVEIRFTTEDWMLYAFCKALWRYEPGYHRELGGGRSDFDINEEKECLMNLLISNSRMHKGKKSKVPEINALERAVEAKHTMGFIFVEIWLPQQPIIVYTQSKEGIIEMVDYVLEIRGRKK